MKKARVLIISNDRSVTYPLWYMLNEMGIRTVKVAATSAEAFRLYPIVKPHLIVCDIEMQEQEHDGLSIARYILFGLRTHVILIARHSDPSYLKKAEGIKPLDYLFKPFNEEQVIATLQIALAKPKVKAGGTEKVNYTGLFTDQELAILKQISQGKTTEEISKKLIISPKTVGNHRSNVCKKLGLKNRNNTLLVWAIGHKRELLQ